MVSTASLLAFIYALGLWATQRANASHSAYPEARQEANGLVFAHFMVGVTSNRRTTRDWDEDMQRANQLGIDAFALNIGVDPYTDQQLEFAYQSAARNSMKVFLSFDFNWWSTSQAAEIGQKIAQYATWPAQLTVDSKVFVSSFAGDGLDVGAVRAAAGAPVFFAPNFHPGSGVTSHPLMVCSTGCPGLIMEGHKAPMRNNNISVADGDQVYLTALAGRPDPTSIFPSMI